MRSTSTRGEKRHTAKDQRSQTTTESNATTATGFIDDFLTICAETGIAALPEVIPMLDSKPYTRYRSKDSTQLLPDELADKGRLSLSSFQRAKMYVFFENVDKQEIIKTLEVKGWRIEPKVFQILDRALENLSHLYVLKLEACGLKGPDIEALKILLNKYSTIRELSLDTNAMASDSFHLLLGNDNKLTKLSLRFCSLCDETIAPLALQLGSVESCELHLLFLNLTNNKIGCVGATKLANALRLNRSLVSLSLAGNMVADAGMQALAMSLSKFRLYPSEVISRRRRVLYQLFREQEAKMGDSVKPISPAGGQVQGKKSIKGPRSLELKKNAKSRGTIAAPTPPNTGLLNKPYRGSIAQFEKPRPGSKKSSRGSQISRGSQGQGYVSTTNSQLFSNILGEPPDWRINHPLLMEVTLASGLLFCQGNFRLSHLNIAYNRIGVKGANALLSALKYQATVTHPQDKGLIHACLEGNRDLLDTFELSKIGEVLHAKETLLKPVTSIGKRTSSAGKTFRD